jgi:hypothetical protein
MKDTEQNDFLNICDNVPCLEYSDCTPCTKMVEETAPSVDDKASFPISFATPSTHSRHLQFTTRMAHRFLRTAKKSVSLVPYFLLTHAEVLHFSLYKGTPIPMPNALVRREISLETVAGSPAEQKQLIRTSQAAAHITPSVPESPFSLCNVTDRER